MQNRQPENNSDKELGRLAPEKAYAFIDGIRVAFDVGALGLGATGDISRTSSLTTAITVEGVCSVLSLIVATHEMVNLCGEQCCRRDGRTVEASNYPTTQYSTYLSFRMASILSSMTGMALMTADLAVNAMTSKTTVGLMLVSVGIFASRALSGSRHKPSGTVLQVDDGDVEQGLLVPLDLPPAPPAGQALPPAPVMEAVVVQPVERAAVAPDAAAPPQRPNHFFQPQPAVKGVAPHPVKAGPRKKRALRMVAPKNL